MSRKMIIALVMSLAVAACGKTEPKSVEYYSQHKDERGELLKKAEENPGKYKDDPDVINAYASKRHDRFKGWSEPTK